MRRDRPHEQSVFDRAVCARLDSRGAPSLLDGRRGFFRYPVAALSSSAKVGSLAASWWAPYFA